MNRKAVSGIMLALLFIGMLTFANLNVTSTGATDTNGTEATGTTMTFDSDITMKFETGNRIWLGTGVYLAFGNDTRGEKVYSIAPGWYKAMVLPDMDYLAPQPDSWYYIYGPPELYGYFIAFHVDDVTGKGKYPKFHIDKAGDYWYRYLRNWTLEPPFDPSTTTTETGLIEAELMIETVETGFNYMSWADFVDYTNPVLGGWYSVTYPGEWADAQFHINYTEHYRYDEELNVDYWWVCFDELLDATGNPVNSMTMPPPMPTDGLDAYRLIDTFQTNQEYYISSPSILVPYTGSKWNITGGELDGYQFTIATTTENLTTRRNYFTIDDLWDETGTPVAGDQKALADPVRTIEAVAEESEVSQLGSWYNVVSGPYPDPWTCWNITTPGLEGTTFCIDIAGEGVFHIDEVVSATGTPGPVTVEPPVASVTAEQFIPKIYIDPTYIEVYPGWTFSVSIKTDYPFHVWSYEFTLNWDPAVLECTSVTNGDLITGAEATYMTLGYDNIAGELYLTGAYFSYFGPPAPQTHGPGILATVTFTATDVGLSDLTLGIETRLVGVTNDGNGEKYNAIDDITGQIIYGQVKVEEAPPMVSVDPQTTTVTVGETFTINITVAGISEEESLYMWEFHMSFDPNILECTEVLEGPFLSDVDSTSWKMAPPSINNYEGTIKATDLLLLYPAEGATGSGTLANITFQAKAEGETTLHFYYTLLATYDWTTKEIKPIEHITIDGEVKVEEGTVRIYVEMPAQGYISGVPVGDTVYVDLYIESPLAWNNTANGIAQWALSVQLDPTVLEPLGVIGASSGYFLYDYLVDSGLIGTHGCNVLYAIDKAAGTIYWIVEGIWPDPPTGAGGSGKLGTLMFLSLSKTDYSPIDIFYEEGVDAYYWTTGGVIHVVDVVDDGHYACMLRVHNIDTGEDFATIQGAIDDSDTWDGHTILVDSGTYYEHLTIDKSISLIGESRETTIIDGSGTGTVIHVTSSNVVISSFTVTNSENGISLSSSDGNKICDNIATNNYVGIRLDHSSYNDIEGNTVSDNTKGIYISFSSRNTLSGNVMAGNSRNFVLTGPTYTASAPVI